MPSPCPAIVDFQASLPAAESFRPAAERILAGDPSQAAWNLFATGDGRFNCGIWTSEAGSWRVAFTENEFCHLLEGVILVKGDDGSEWCFSAGQAFVTPAGFTGTWTVLEPARKFYAVYE